MELQLMRGVDALLVVLVTMCATGCSDGLGPFVIAYPYRTYVLTPVSGAVRILGLEDDGTALWTEGGRTYLWRGSRIELPLYGIDLGPDGTVLGSVDGRTVLWQGGVVTEISQGTPVDISGSGTVLLRGADGRVYLWREETGLDEFAGPLPDSVDSPSDYVTLHALTDDDRWILSGSEFLNGVDPWGACYRSDAASVERFWDGRRHCHSVAGMNGLVLVNTAFNLNQAGYHVVGAPWPQLVFRVPEGAAGYMEAYDLNAAGWVVAGLPGRETLLLQRQDTVFVADSLRPPDRWRLTSPGTLFGKGGAINERGEVLGVGISGPDSALILLRPR